MVSSYTTNKQIEKPGHNDYVDDWDVPVNANMDIIDACFGTVTTINMTSLTTYTLTYADLRAGSIRFTGTLSNTAVTVKIPNGVSGSFTIVNATTAAGSSSALTMSWGSGGTSYVIGQGLTQRMAANGSALTWTAEAPVAVTTINSLSVTGQTDITIPREILAGGVVTLSGSVSNTTVQIHPPLGWYTPTILVNTWTKAGGSSILAMFSPGGGGGGYTIAQNSVQLVAWTLTDAWLMGTGTQP